MKKLKKSSPKEHVLHVSHVRQLKSRIKTLEEENRSLLEELQELAANGWGPGTC